MSLFGRSSRSLIQRLATNEWKDDEEKRAMLHELQESTARLGRIAALLWAKDAAVRSAAGMAFAKRAFARDVAALLQALVTQPGENRSYALRVFGRLDPELTIPVLEEAIWDDAVERQRLAWSASFEMPQPHRRTFMERAVREAPGALRHTALLRLLNDHPPWELKDLLLSQAGVEDERLRIRVVKTLVQIRDPEIFGAMITRFYEDQTVARELAGRYLREYAREAPEAVREWVLDMLAQGDDGLRRLSIEILTSAGDPTETLCEILIFCHGLAPWIRQRIMDALRAQGEHFLQASIALLNHDDEEIRDAALFLAEAFDDPRVVPPICELLSNSDDWWIKIAACDTLGKFADARSTPALIEALDDPDTRWSALDALALVRDPSAIEPIAALIQDPAPEIRIEVIKALSNFDSEQVFNLLKALSAEDPHFSVRHRAQTAHQEMARRMQLQVIEDEPTSVAASARSLSNPIDRFLAQIRDTGASDLHLSPGEPPFLRKAGSLQRIEGAPPLPLAQIQAILYSLISPHQRETFDATGDLDFCYTVPQVGRYRANAYRKRSGVGLTFRVIPNTPPTFSELRLPAHLNELLDHHQGLVLLAGPTGSGKSTTLAAILNLINESKPVHVVTLEDPVEFVHPFKSALINQREVGTHASSFSRALRGALREDPDVVVVGELRDLETTRMSLEAAETGHLVITTMPTTSAVGTVERLVSAFPPDEQQQVRVGLSESLKYVISQSLLPRADDDGRCAVFEILKGTPAVCAMIRDNKTASLASMMQIGRRQGMQTMDMDLEELVNEKLIAPETAYMRAMNPELFESRCSNAFLKTLKFQ